MPKRGTMSGSVDLGVSPASPLGAGAAPTITLDAISPEIFDNIGTCWWLGPLDLCVNLDADKKEISASAKVLGTTIGSVVLNTTNPNATIGGSIGVASARIVLEADFNTDCLNFTAEACVGFGPFKQCADWTEDWCW